MPISLISFFFSFSSLFAPPVPLSSLLCRRLERALDPWMSQFANALREAAVLPFYRATAMILASL